VRAIALLGLHESGAIVILINKYIEKFLKFLQEYLAALFNRNLMPTALKVSVVVGFILLIINHSSALIKGKMN